MMYSMRGDGNQGRSVKLGGGRERVKTGTDVVRRRRSPYNRVEIQGMRPSEAAYAGTAGSRNRRA